VEDKKMQGQKPQQKPAGQPKAGMPQQKGGSQQKPGVQPGKPQPTNTAGDRLCY
jgi:hypothetical protein